MVARRRFRCQPGLADQNDPVVVDVGARRSGDDEIAEGGEEAVAVVIFEQLVGAQAERRSAR
jgi:hypothetical protein